MFNKQSSQIRELERQIEELKAEKEKYKHLADIGISKKASLKTIDLRAFFSCGFTSSTGFI